MSCVSLEFNTKVKQEVKQIAADNDDANAAPVEEVVVGTVANEAVAADIVPYHDAAASATAAGNDNDAIDDAVAD